MVDVERPQTPRRLKPAEGRKRLSDAWIPACAGMTGKKRE